MQEVLNYLKECKTFYLATLDSSNQPRVRPFGTAEIFENHFPKIKKTKIVLRYGKPIYINELSKEDQKNIGTYFQNVIAEMLEENKALL